MTDENPRRKIELEARIDELTTQIDRIERRRDELAMELHERFPETNPDGGEDDEIDSQVRTVKWKANVDDDTSVSTSSDTATTDDTELSGLEVRKALMDALGRRTFEDAEDIRFATGLPLPEIERQLRYLEQRGEIYHGTGENGKPEWKVTNIEN